MAEARYVVKARRVVKASHVVSHVVRLVVHEAAAPPVLLAPGAPSGPSQGVLAGMLLQKTLVRTMHGCKPGANICARTFVRTVLWVKLLRGVRLTAPRRLLVCCLFCSLLPAAFTRVSIRDNCSEHA